MKHAQTNWNELKRLLVIDVQILIKANFDRLKRVCWFEMYQSSILSGIDSNNWCYVTLMMSDSFNMASQ